MNKPSRPTPAIDRPSPDYNADGYGWAMAQAQLIRERRFDAIDWDNVAEEIESVGKSEQSKAESALRVLTIHILKWQFQPERRGRSWALSIAAQRVAFAKAMRDNPGLKANLDIMRADAHERARLEAAKETDKPLATFPETPLEWSHLIDAPFGLGDL